MWIRCASRRSSTSAAIRSGRKRSAKRRADERAGERRAELVRLRREAKERKAREKAPLGRHGSSRRGAEGREVGAVPPDSELGQDSGATHADVRYATRAWPSRGHRPSAQTLRLACNCTRFESGRCAALARIVHRTALPTDPRTQGRQVRPRGAERWVVPNLPHPPQWASHTFVDTHQHAVDAITGVDGHASDRYLQDHWRFHEHLALCDVDVRAVDPGIEDDI